MLVLSLFVGKNNGSLYSSSGFRLQFLGGISGVDSMCYQYKLHEYKHKEGLKKVELNDEITVSLQICDSSNINNNGVVSDYLTKVSINNGDYYVDDEYFYYVTKNSTSSSSTRNDSNDNIIELCFNDKFNNNNNNNNKSRSGELIASTEYCIQHNNETKLCSTRGVFVTDICGIDSIGKNNKDLPPTNIDYVPIPGKQYR